MRIGDVEAFLAGRSCPPAVHEAIVAFIEGEKLLPGKRGTGQYSESQVELFARLTHALDWGRSVMTGTAEFLGPSSADRGGHDGHGLIPGHAYTVVRAYRRKQDGVCFVTLKDPYEKTGRAYHVDPTSGAWKAVAVDVPGSGHEPGKTHEFHGELGDFQKRFKRLVVGDKALKDPDKRSPMGWLRKLGGARGAP